MINIITITFKSNILSSLFQIQELTILPVGQEA